MKNQLDKNIHAAARAAAAGIGAAKWARHNTQQEADDYLKICIKSASVVVLDHWVSGEKRGTLFEKYNPEEHDGMATYRVFGDGRVRSLLRHRTA